MLMILLIRLRSLLLTSVFSFLAPVVLTGVVLGVLSAIGWSHQLTAMSSSSIAHVVHFLAIFGSGRPEVGLLIIGLTCSLVGILLDTYSFYREQLRHHE